MIGKRIRMERLMDKESRKLVIVPLDHGVSIGPVPGLVDFPHLRDGEEVHLCWKCGEDEIRHWHGLDEGYAARKPL